MVAVHAPEGMPRRDEIQVIVSSLEQISVMGPDNNGDYELFVSNLT